VALGRQLFFDERLSGDGSRSCYSCHVCDKGLTDGLPTAIGAYDKKLPRASPTLWNVGYHKELYWDGRSPTLEKQASAAWTGPNMGAAAAAIVQKLNALEGYRRQFQAVFASGATPDNVVQAISAFERTLSCGTTAWDRWQAGDAGAVSAEVKAGWEVFRKLQCAQCHAGVLFTDLRYHNVGIGMDAAQPDIGRKKVSNDAKDTGAMKTPTLRDIARSAPYFHDGSAATLEAAVDVMLAGGKANEYLDTQNIQKREATPAEKQQLLAFLRALDCECNLSKPELPQ
jgi:cytochrome c peroxidase